MLTYVLGPLVSIFPKRWREALPFSCYVRWAPTAISGIAESAAALVVLSHWYFYAMNTWVGLGVDVALNGALTGKSGPELRPQDIGGVAVIVWASHPLAWLIGYFGLEGAHRLGAAFTGTSLGMLPLFVSDRQDLPLCIRRWQARPAEGSCFCRQLFFRDWQHPRTDRRSWTSIGFGRALLWARRWRGISEICASQKKDGWDPPRTVR